MSKRTVLARGLRGVTLQPWDDHEAMEVVWQLDPADLAEIAVVHGPKEPEQVWADWRAGNPYRLLNLIAHDRDQRAIALVGLSHTGCPGTAGAALLTVHRDLFPRDLAALAVLLRDELPAFAREMGLNRIECRCWDGHPTARHLLHRLGFDLEARLHGFGDAGRTTLLQYALIHIEPWSD